MREPGNFSKQKTRNCSLNMGAILLLLPAALGAAVLSAVEPAKAAGPPAVMPAEKSSDAQIQKDLLALENRFFFHSYAHDPLEKRLERIELLALGNVQYGTNIDRLGRLKAAITERDREAAKQMASQAKTGSANYPAINTLEWRVLKKTYASESIDQRLERLEKQLFGVPAQAMSYVDRIDRLKKTVGIGMPTPTPLAGGGVKRGPMPRSGGTSGGGEEIILPYGDEDSPEIGQLRPYTPLPRNPFLAPQGGRVMISPFASPNFSPDSSAVGLGELMDRMQRHMVDVMKQFSSSPFFDEMPEVETPQMVPMPSPLPGAGTVPKNKVVPGLKKRATPREELPPYSDPNSI